MYEALLVPKLLDIASIHNTKVMSRMQRERSMPFGRRFILFGRRSISFGRQSILHRSEADIVQGSYGDTWRSMQSPWYLLVPLTR